MGTRRVEVDPERREKIAAAVVMRQQGATLAQAEAETGIPDASIQRWAKRLAQDPSALKPLEEQIAAGAALVAQRGFELLQERLPDLDDGKLIAATGMATDKLAMRQGWGQRSTGLGDSTVDRLGAALERIAASGGLSVELRVTTPAAPPIDITHTDDTSTS